MNHEDPSGSFSEWITRPQMLVALSALLLSVCGLFVAVYETWLIRQEQRASVWPHVEVSASLRRDSLRLWVENTGVGPARIRAAAVTYEGQRQAGWSELIRSLGIQPDSVGIYYSLLSGRVLSSDSPETIFSVARDAGPAAPRLIDGLKQEILEGAVDVRVCYCSVYDQCWTDNLQGLVQRVRGVERPVGAREVEDCDEAGSSAI